MMITAFIAGMVVGWLVLGVGVLAYGWRHRNDVSVRRIGIRCGWEG